jgi:hypothetical protein
MNDRRRPARNAAATTPTALHCNQEDGERQKRLWSGVADASRRMLEHERRRLAARRLPA